MLKETVLIKAPHGLHARPSSLLTKEASKYTSDIKLIKEGKEFNAKSIMNLMTAGLKFNDEVTIEVSGADEAEAIAKVKELFDTGFGEI